MDRWRLEYQGFDADEEPLREALCTTGNGYFASRGAMPWEVAGGPHYPGTYRAGLYNRLTTHIAGASVENESLVNLPNWLLVRLRLGKGPWLCVDDDEFEVVSLAQWFDLRRGLLRRQMRVCDRAGRETRIETRRLVHMRFIHLGALELTVVPENWSGTVLVRTALDGRVINAGVARYRDLASDHLEPLDRWVEPDGELISLKMITSHSAVQIAEAARTRLWCDGEAITPQRRSISRSEYAAHEMTVSLEEGSELRLEKIAALYTSRDPAISEVNQEAVTAVRRAPSFAALEDSHAAAWEHLWRRFGLELELGDPETDLEIDHLLNLHTAHLLQTVSSHTMDLDVGVPARGWHGEAYRGHIFWDELFIFPMLYLREPEITRSLILYRYRRLNEARAAAEAAGYRGAMFPWQSGSNGREETQTLHLNPKSGRWLPDNSQRQRHVGAAVAYNVWQYYQASADHEFLIFYGAEMILEIARFWSSIAELDPDRGRFVIRGVMGPDEFHDAYPDRDEPGLDNNAYTNVMAAWIMGRALEILERVPERHRRELRARLRLEDDEVERWEEMTRRLYVPFHDGVISQFEGYERLEELDWDGYRQRYGDIHRLDRILEAEGDTPNRYKASKQADVLMLLYLFTTDELREVLGRLGYELPKEMVQRMVGYYLERTSHGSTLSWIVHSWVLARSDRARSWEMFRQAILSDVHDVQGGTTPEGIHLGAMAGTVDIIQRAYTGINTRGDVLRFDPCLPEGLDQLRMHLRYRGHALEVRLDGRLRIESLPGHQPPVTIALREQEHRLCPGEVLELEAYGTPGRAEER